MRAGRGIHENIRVLLVMEEPLAALAALVLRHGRYETSRVGGASGAGEALRELASDLVMIDVDMESGRAMDLLRVAGDVPKIAFTRHRDMKTKLAIYQRGADDIVEVPFTPDELVARALVLMRRSYGLAVPFIPKVKIGQLEMDLLAETVRIGDYEPHLTPMEHALLYLLVANAGRVLSREAILNNLWGLDYVAESNVVDRHVRKLRVKLQNHWRRPQFIETVPGKGYRFVHTAAEREREEITAS